jgi:hypothetical protein
VPQLVVTVTVPSGCTTGGDSGTPIVVATVSI